MRYHTDLLCWWYYMLVRYSVQEIATTLNLLVKPLHVRSWEINQELSTLVKCLGVLWCGACGDITFMVKDMLLHLSSPTTKKETQCLLGLLGFWRQHIPNLNVLLLPIYWVTQKAASFEWSQNRRKLCNRSRLLCKLLCPWAIWSSRSNGTWGVIHRSECCLEPLEGPYIVNHNGAL